MSSGTLSKYSLLPSSFNVEYRVEQSTLYSHAPLTVEKLGYHLPWVLSGTALATIAYALYSLLSPTTPVGNWIGYQILGGVGNGAAAPGVRVFFSSSCYPKRKRSF